MDSLNSPPAVTSRPWWWLGGGGHVTALVSKARHSHGLRPSIPVMAAVFHSSRVCCRGELLPQPCSLFADVSFTQTAFLP